MSEKERHNMMQFLIRYFGADPNQLSTFNDCMLESTYDFAYRRTLMECDF